MIRDQLELIQAEVCDVVRSHPAFELPYSCTKIRTYHRILCAKTVSRDVIAPLSKLLVALCREVVVASRTLIDRHRAHLAAYMMRPLHSRLA